MTGSRLINRIRRLGLPKGRVPVLAVTAFDSAHRRVELFHIGIDDYVAKPIFPAELRARIHNLIARKRAEERNRDVLRRPSWASQLSMRKVSSCRWMTTPAACSAWQTGRMPGNFASLLVADEGASLDSLRWLIGTGSMQRLRFDGRHRDGFSFPLQLSFLEIEPADGAAGVLRC